MTAIAPNNFMRRGEWMKQQFRYVVRAALIMCIAGLSGCVTVAKRDIDQVGRATRSLIFPAPPDEPRFVFERAIRNSADVVPEADESALRRALTGTSAASGEPLTKPYAIAVHKGKIFVSDSVGRSVRVFDVPGRKYYTIGDEDGDGRIAKPLGIDVDGEGNLYVADATQKQILVFDNAGKFLRKFGGPKAFERLSSVTVDPSGERVYVVDIGGVSSNKHQVRVFNGKTGAPLFDIGTRGAGPGQFNLPRDVALGKDGRIYVVDGGNFRVQIFDKDGKFLKSFGSVGKQLGNFARPKEIATDREGNVYVADTAFGNIQIFTAEGELLMFIGDRSEQDRPAGYMLPSGVAVDEDGRIYFVDQWFARIDIFRPYGLKETDGYLGMRPAVTNTAKQTP
jgi:DNA-binding beta-propeller fold protein YncE